MKLVLFCPALVEKNDTFLNCDKFSLEAGYLTDKVSEYILNQIFSGKLKKSIKLYTVNDAFYSVENSIIKNSI